MTPAKLLELGFSVIPIKDKKPLVAWKEYQTRRATADEVGGWERQFPGCQWGVVTGPVSNILVLDQDFKTPLGRPVPPTWKVETNRGFHYYFEWSPAYASLVTTKADLGPGLDVRGEGGYVVVHRPEPGFGVGRPKAAPAWLVQLLGGAAPAGQPRSVVQVADGIKEGNRNDSFASLAGGLRARGYKPDEIFALLRDKANAVGLSEEELRGVCNSVGRYPSRHAETEASSLSEFLQSEDKVEWICDGLIPKAAIGFVAGLPESGKTWGVIDLALSCASTMSTPWLAHFAVKPCRVLFIDQERHKSETQRRFRAVMAAKGLDASKLQLHVKSGSTIRLDLEPSFEAFKRLLKEIQPGLVIIDSWVTLLSKSDENDRSAVQMVLEHVKELRDEIGCTFIFIDHLNKTDWQDSADGRPPSVFRMVGSVAKPAAAEFVFTVRKQDAETSTYYHAKSTMASTHEPFTVAVRDLDEAHTKIAVEVI